MMRENMFNLQKNLKSGGSLIALFAAASFPTVAFGQVAAGGDQVEQVVVTGTSIRGIQPVGSNLISFDQQDIQSSAGSDVDVFAITKSIPALSTSQATSQSTGDVQPEIHELGASASNSTLVLIDGHRTALTGTNHPLVDPSIIPVNMLQSIEVLPDGASAIYGSDAVAGVVNFITRRSFDGLQLGGSDGFGQDYGRYNANALFGKSWDGGGVIMGYTFSYASALKSISRPYVNNCNKIPQGGTNFCSFASDPASIQVNGSGPVYTSPTSSATIASTSAALAPYNLTVPEAGDILPREIRQDFMVKVSQDYGNLSANVDFVLGNRTDDTNSPLGTLTATVYGTGAQANPFFVAPPGTNATKETIRFSSASLLDPLLGPSHSLNGAENGYLDLNLAYAVPGGDWRVTFSNVAGKDHSYNYNNGSLCAACAYLALNGTVQSGGSTTSVSIPGSSTVITQLPLTTQNALDVWDPVGSNKTNPAVLNNLNQSASTTDFANNILDSKLGIDGTLFKLPGGPVKFAAGVEYARYFLTEHQSAGAGTGFANASGNSENFYTFHRDVQSYYEELNIPIIGSDNALPLIQGLDIDSSSRYDHYSDMHVGTWNPKVGVEWDVVDGLKFRGSMATSFVAPAADILGNQYGNHAGSGFTTNTSALTSINLTNFPAAAFVPGCNTAEKVCNLPTTTQGIIINNGNRNIKPQTGFSWSIGADFAPDFLPNFSTSITYFNNRFDGANTAPEIASILAAPGLFHLLTFYPGGATQAQIATATAHIPQSGSIPNPVYYIFFHEQGNVINIQVRGIDLAVNYSYPTDNWGTFNFSDNLTEFTEYTFQTVGTPAYSVLNTNGIISIFPTIQEQMRVGAGWRFGDFDAEVFLNFTGGYRNWGSGTVAPINYDPASGSPVSGGDVVHSESRYDIHLSYDFHNDMLGDDQVYLSGQNIFASRPPFVNNANGFDNFESTPLGRVVTIGLRTKW
jgi:iron complex outermembrane receptor protein